MFNFNFSISFQEVLSFRQLQVEENKKKKQEEYEKKRIEEAEDMDNLERYKLEQEMLKKEREKKKKMYGEELKRQEELIKMQRVSINIKIFTRILYFFK